jgi:hypothetical protein
MFTKSIRWRLQLWLAFLLVCTLSGFGIASFEVYRTKQYQQVDEQLSHRVEGLGRMARGPFFSRGERPPFRNARWQRRTPKSLG